MIINQTKKLCERFMVPSTQTANAGKVEIVNIWRSILTGHNVKQDLPPLSHLLTCFVVSC